MNQNTATPFTCFRCDDGNTPLYCLNCADEMKRTGEPSRAAILAAWSLVPGHTREAALNDLRLCRPDLWDEFGGTWSKVEKTRAMLKAAVKEQAAASAERGLLNILADIRAAIGDPEGKLMQDELVERCRVLREAAERPED